MKNVTVLCSAAVLALLLSGSGQTMADNRDADAQSLKDNEARWNQDWATKDVDKIVAHYSDDAVLMAPGMEPSSGKESIRKVLEEMAKDPALSLKFQAAKAEVAKSGDVGYTQV